MSVMQPTQASPLVGEVGGGPAASAATGIFDSPPPNPPHKGEGLKRLQLAPNATAKAKRLRRDMTDAERLLWRTLRSALPEYHWRKQVPLGPYFADFCSHNAKLIIEVDGGQHEESRDSARTAFLNGEGFRVVRFWNNEVLQNTDGVIDAIANVLGAHA